MDPSIVCKLVGPPLGPIRKKFDPSVILEIVLEIHSNQVRMGFKVIFGHFKTFVRFVERIIGVNRILIRIFDDEI